EAYGQEPVLEPERGFLDNQVADRQAAVTGGQAAVLYDDIYFQGTVVNGKIAGGGGDKLLLYLFLFQAGLEVPGHAKMAHGIGTVGGQANFKDLIALHLEYLGTWGAGLQPLIEDHDPIMAGAQPELILGTDHSLAFLPTDLSFFDHPCFPFVRIQGSPD